MGRLGTLKILRLLKANPLSMVFSATQETSPPGIPDWILRGEERW
jgi:hypothetical protein